ncbi:hypothetical protein SLE2022_197170 [Rubroshorea leprosula]|uniref:Phytocyanin domain-containing protein n=1 Tax=Rubroshorea leprosula TaxID=152421 RepID=A0AAV5JA07_9ROSI|nr:hypothetical protein SLEP1_g19921 [Rubroshorea leprosula]
MDGLMKTALWLVSLANILKAAQGENIHFVGGGKYNWAPNVNFTEWSSDEHFYVKDWLYFGFDKNMYNVLEVNETSYEKCIDTDFITNITKGGRDVFQLSEVRQYFFISGRGFCFNGLKVAVNVEDVPPKPSPSSPKNASSSISCCRVCLLLTAFWTFVSPFILLLG